MVDWTTSRKKWTPEQLSWQPDLTFEQRLAQLQQDLTETRARSGEVVNEWGGTYRTMTPEQIQGQMGRTPAQLWGGRLPPSQEEAMRWAQGQYQSGRKQSALGIREHMLQNALAKMQTARTYQPPATPAPRERMQAPRVPSQYLPGPVRQTQERLRSREARLAGQGITRPPRRSRPTPT